MAQGSFTQVTVVSKSHTAIHIKNNGREHFTMYLNDGVLKIRHYTSLIVPYMTLSTFVSNT